LDEDEDEDEPITLHEQIEIEQKKGIRILRGGVSEPKSIGPIPKTPEPIPKTPAPEEPIQPTEPIPAPEKEAVPLIISRELMEPLLEKMITKGVIEGFDLRQTEKIADGRWPDEKLIDEFNEAITTFNEGGFQSALVYVMLKASQLYIRADMDLEEEF